ncbi:MAG: DUF3619 family protein [Casimicrobiaceae bacterium]
MIDRDAEFARKLIAHLDRENDRLEPETVHRLQQGRATALAALDIGAPDTPGAGAARALHARHRGWVVATRWAAVALLVIGTGVGWQQWRQGQLIRQTHENAELDAQILSSDLPIDALLDRGFQNWLNTSYEH